MSFFFQQRRLILAASVIAFVLVYHLYGFRGTAAEWVAPTKDAASPDIKPAVEPVVSKTISQTILTTFPEEVHTSSVQKLESAIQKLETSLSKALETSTSIKVSTTPAVVVVKPSPAPPAPTPNASKNPVSEKCVGYEQLQRSRPGPLSEGKRQFPYSRPPPECRTFNLPALEALLEEMKSVIRDPDLYRLFENSYPNTLDTTIKWRGYATKKDASGNETTTDEELAFVITGDIDAMWLRDSASQIYSYLPLLEASDSPDSLASLWRGVINIHARYIKISPFCHSFQPPPESGVRPTTNGAYHNNKPIPAYDPIKVFDCKWELDSLASFLQISSAYYKATGDAEFFQKYNWISAVRAAVDAAGSMRLGTYAKDGKVEHSAWTFVGWTNRGTETLSNDGIGNPTKENGMVRSAFRPSDDACIYQLLVPANMMWAKYLEEASLIMEHLEGADAKELTPMMRDFAFGIRKAIDADAIVHHREFGDMYAYEIDGYGGVNLMDDANVPSLLSIPLFNYTVSSFPLPESTIDHAKVYANTRAFALSSANPYFMTGPALSAIGGPHIGPGKPWPMAAIVRSITALLPLKRAYLTSSEDYADNENEVITEIRGQMRQVLDSTAGWGVVHESVNAWNDKDWSRSWFGWANGLWGELIIKLARSPGHSKLSILLSEEWQ